MNGGPALSGLGLIWQTLSQVSAAYGIFDLSQRLSVLFRRRAEVEEAHYRDWRERGAMPSDVHDFIKDRSTWTTPQLSSLLGCSSSEAEAFIVGKGFYWDEDDRAWKRQEAAQDEAGVIDTLDELALFVDLLEASEGGSPAQQVREVVEEYFRTGQVRSPLTPLDEGGL